MIELKNISKTYRSKKGTSTQALNNISLKFDTKGMTFILGKSGSGKSTLLNILGGLDQYDSGEMIILGKSSKDFSHVDFDSYRNTYIGFVFQEYNILEDYNVYENIILALELQQKKVEEEKVDALLEKLELKSLKMRKVNELSGGQKQRVAIARALIKEPKIILADEPTGNLDSKTSKQVMELLKEISKEKLVIVVSHDAESANTYGDRIITIQDGLVESDHHSAEENKFGNTYEAIRSKLSLKSSFRLGLGSLRHKKVKLAFTILLTVLSLLFLSITDTLSSYNIDLAHAKLLKDSKEEFVQIEKYRLYEKEFSYRDDLLLTETDIQNIQNRLKGNHPLIYKIREDYSYFSPYEVFHIGTENVGYYYGGGRLELEIVESNDFHYLNTHTILGKLPTNRDEIVISNVVANMILESGITPYGEETLYTPKNYQELLASGKLFYFGTEGKVKIVGIIEYDLDKYQDVIKKNNENKTLTNQESSLLSDYYKKRNNIYNKIYVPSGFIENLEVIEHPPLDSSYHYQVNTLTDSIHQEGKYYSPSLAYPELEYFNGSSWVSANHLQKNEIILNVGQLKAFDSTDYYDKLTDYINKHLGKSQLELEKEFFEEYVSKFNILGSEVEFSAKGIGNSIIDSNDRNKLDNVKLKVVGLTGLISRDKDYYYISSLIGKDYEMKITPVTGILVAENTQRGFYDLLKAFSYTDSISSNSTYSNDVLGLLQTISLLKKIAFYVALVFIFFTIILITNFMFSSISYRRKEIGILRGLGARSIDIAKIFLWEGILLASTSFLLTSISLIGVTNLLNKIIMSGMSLILTPFILTPRQFIIILLFVFSIVVIASILPIMKIARQKPMDAILKK